ncbi:GPN-loop GTPase 2 isoform X1 [Oopsacas minuta]|uniref:GPN-loop GTPase 2 n=1 Tax=Oopsacas minuta TaxID=111878 RepID=A0AAV7KK84_9METZ|nr:GPN-loop GTPase 2 isoform X1 [Oopsacas minuta]
MSYGEIVVGLPGSGKSTFCKFMSEYLSERGRQVEVINLDPANERTPYESRISISELVTHDDVMRELGIGPNGSYIYCIEFLEANFDWLLGKIKEKKNCYYIIDCPGQIELFTHHNSIRNICKLLVDNGLKLTAVQLMDCQFCNDPAKFISGTMISLCTMLQLELPHVNILSKMDLFDNANTMRQDMYTEVLDLSYLLDTLHDHPLTEKYGALNKRLTDLIQNFSLVSFKSFDIRNRESYSKVMEEIDRANGYLICK